MPCATRAFAGWMILYHYLDSKHTDAFDLSTQHWVSRGTVQELAAQSRMAMHMCNSTTYINTPALAAGRRSSMTDSLSVW